MPCKSCECLSFDSLNFSHYRKFCTETTIYLQQKITTENAENTHSNRLYILTTTFCRQCHININVPCVWNTGCDKKSIYKCTSRGTLCIYGHIQSQVHEIILITSSDVSSSRDLTAALSLSLSVRVCDFYQQCFTCTKSRMCYIHCTYMHMNTIPANTTITSIH